MFFGFTLCPVDSRVGRGIRRNRGSVEILRFLHFMSIYMRRRNLTLLCEPITVYCHQRTTLRLCCVVMLRIPNMKCFSSLYTQSLDVFCGIKREDGKKCIHNTVNNFVDISMKYRSFYKSCYGRLLSTGVRKKAELL